METHQADCWKNANMAKIVEDRPYLSCQEKFTFLKSHFRSGDNYVLQRPN